MSSSSVLMVLMVPIDSMFSMYLSRMTNPF